MDLRSNFFYDFYHLYIILGCLIKENKNQKMAGTQVNSGYFLTGIRRVKEILLQKIRLMETNIMIYQGKNLFQKRKKKTYDILDPN